MGGSKARLIQISGASTARPRGHVVFVHGLNGSSRSWWSARGAELHESWPGWLSREVADLGVWVADYPASPLWWVRAPGIRLEHRAATILSLLTGSELGSAPLLFICHSLGGLVIKKALQLASESTNPTALAVAAATRGVAFLGTPHLGSDWAHLTNTQMGRLMGSDAVLDLRPDNEELARLQTWYAQFSESRGIRHLVAYEVRPIKLLWQQLPLICPTDTSAPNLPNANYLPVEADHVHLSKPAQYDSLTMTANSFVAECLGLPQAVAGRPRTGSAASPDAMRAKDIEAISQVLAGVTAAPIGRFVEDLPTGWFRTNVFSYWEAFGQATTDATFLLYDDHLSAMVAAYRLAWEQALHCESRYFFASGGDSVKLDSSAVTRTTTMDQVLGALSQTAQAMDDARRELLRYLHTNYPELDLSRVPDPLAAECDEQPPTT